MRKKEQDSGELEGFLTEGTSFHGELSFTDTLNIYGEFKGAVRAGRILNIGESAEVDAEIEVAVVSVAGHLRGRVRATERVELLPTARAECSLDCASLVVHEGAAFDGECVMSKKAETEVAENNNVKQFISSE